MWAGGGPRGHRVHGDSAPDKPGWTRLLEWQFVTTDEVQLRLAGIDDAPDLLAIIRSAFGVRRPASTPPAAMSDSTESVRRRIAEGAGVIAAVNGEDAGCLLLGFEPDQVLTMSRVSVLPTHQHEGIAAAMARAAAEYGADLGFRRVELMARADFPELVTWWQLHGFEVDREVPGGFILGAGLPVSITVPTPEDMRRLGELLAGHLRGGDLLVANGELGAGKTTLAQGLGAGLRVDGPVISPTFVLARNHHSSVGGPDLVHVDAYRMGSAAELEDIDLDSSMADSVTLVEWGAGLAEGLADDRLDIDIVRSADPADDTRVVYLRGHGARWATEDLYSLRESFVRGTAPHRSAPHVADQSEETE